MAPCERVFADQTTNPASSTERSWEKDVEYFKRYANWVDSTEKID